jgi:hypothetical protein
MTHEEFITKVLDPMANGSLSQYWKNYHGLKGDQKDCYVFAYRSWQENPTSTGLDELGLKLFRKERFEDGDYLHLWITPPIDWKVKLNSGEGE